MESLLDSPKDRGASAVGPQTLFHLCAVQYLHWECCIRDQNHSQRASNTRNWHQTLATGIKHSQLVLTLPIELQGPPTHMTTFDYLSILYLLNTKCKCHSRKERFGQICIMATHTKKQLFTKKQLGIERQKKYAMNNNKALITISH